MRIPKLDSKNHVHHYFAFCISFYCNLKGKLLSTYTTYIYIYIYIYTHTQSFFFICDFRKNNDVELDGILLQFADMKSILKHRILYFHFGCVLKFTSKIYSLRYVHYKFSLLAVNFGTQPLYNNLAAM